MNQSVLTEIYHLDLVPHEIYEIWLMDKSDMVELALGTVPLRDYYIVGPHAYQSDDGDLPWERYYQVQLAETVCQSVHIQMSDLDLDIPSRIVGSSESVLLHQLHHPLQHENQMRTLTRLV